MTRSAQLSKRVTTVQAAQHRRYLTWLTERIAANLGITPEDVHRQADELVQRWNAIGATTSEAKLADVAQELDLSTDELRERLRADPLTGNVWHD